MKYFFRISICLALLGLASTTFAQQADTTKTTQDLVTKARELVTQMSAGKFAQATRNFDSTMTAAMPPEKFAETWNAIVSQVGPFKSQGTSRQEKMMQYDVVFVTCEFEKMPLDMRVVFDSQARVAGLFFSPAAAKIEYESPEYADPDSFRKSEVTIGSGEWSLPGTLTMPWGNRLAPVVVLVHGSGPNDRDETIGPNKPFRDLAEGLSSRGIAVLRYDKRTLKYGEKVVAMLDSFTVKEETIDDALAAVETLRRTRGIDSTRIFVLGHSLGGMLVPRIAEGDDGIAGFIVMAGTARPLEDVVLEQYTYIFSLDGVVSEEEQAELVRLKERAARVKGPELSRSTPAAELPLGLPAGYWLDLKGYKPAEAARKIGRPMLILQGGRDYQVTEADFNLWKGSLDGRKDVETKLYPRLNHLFISGEGKIAPEEYNKPGHVDRAVIEDIAAWVNGH